MNTCPIIKECDLLIIGASSSAVAAALAARKAGATVCVVSPLNYMGEDICAYLRFELAAGESAHTELSQKIYSGKKRPAVIKRTLEQALVEADIDLIFSSSPIAVLQGTEGATKGSIGGVVIANRCGRQGITAKRIIDCTEFALCARVAKSAFSEWNGGQITAEYRLIADEALHQAASQMDELFHLPSKNGDVPTPMYRYLRNENLKNNSIQEWTAAQKRMQNDYWQHNASVYSQKALMIPADGIIARVHVDLWQDADSFALDALRTADAALTVCGPCAGVSREIAATIYRPAQAMIIAERLGALLAEECRQCEHITELELRAHGEACSADDDIRMYSNGFEPVDHGYKQIVIEKESLPRLGQWDTIVVGGGTGGASAAIASARQGARTVVLEAQHALGGVGTLGMISVYYYGNRCGFTSEMDEAVSTMGPDAPYEGKTFRWIPQWKQAWYHRQLQEKHVDLCYQAVAYGVWREDSQQGDGSRQGKGSQQGEGSRVRGVLVTTPYGCGVMESQSVIDATGAADIAAAAGAPCRRIGKDHMAVQGTGLSPIYIGTDYSNTDHTFIDDNNQRDVTTAMIAAKKKFPDAFDISQLVNSRERRQIYGDYELSPIDFFRDHTFHDSICFASSNFDSHGYTVHPVFTLKSPNEEQMWVHVPYRALLPQGLDNVLVTGLGVSAQRDVLPVIRMQADVQNQGYAAGYAATVALQEKCSLRAVPIKKVQKHLIEIGNLAQEVLEHTDSAIPNAEELQEAVSSGWDSYKGLSIICAYPEQSLSVIHGQYTDCSDPQQKLMYAKIMGLLGDSTGTETLFACIEKESWDEGWNYRGMGQFGMSCSVYDAAWMAIGRSAPADAKITLLAQRVDELLNNGVEGNGACAFSHARAIAIACEGIGNQDHSKALAKSIHAILSQENISGFHQLDIHAVQNALTDNQNETTVRNQSLRELALARALWYCGDYNGLAEKTLNHYANDIRGLFASHAHAILTCGVREEVLV